VHRQDAAKDFRKKREDRSERPYSGQNLSGHDAHDAVALGELAGHKGITCDFLYVAPCTVVGHIGLWQDKIGTSSVAGRACFFVNWEIRES
jgi:hypothetical protein